MRRIHPLFSSFGFIATAILLAGLALGVWRSGGRAFSPGRLSAQGNGGSADQPAESPGAGIESQYASHADFEGRCSLCHDPLKTTQDQLCLACHTNVAGQIQLGQGTHGKIEQVDRCYRCHTDHKGKDANILLPGLKLFDHSNTSFSLAWHQLDYDAQAMDCAACHSEGNFAMNLENCSSCHMRHDPAFMDEHLQAFGEDCLACHDGHDRMANFEHAQTDFPLGGKHAELTCTECHHGPPGAQFTQGPVECVSCHDAPVVHLDLFGTDCASCHTSQSWSPALWEGTPFGHEASTAFSLRRHAEDFAGQPMTCAACHASGKQQPASLSAPDFRQFDLSVCASCHSQAPEGVAFMQRHQEQFGPVCLDCHDGVDRMSDFDHARFFPLDGAHAELECQSCHKDRNGTGVATFSGTPDQCSECHAEPDIHAGYFGLQCQDCHTTTAWSPARLSQHNFPLDHGGQGLVSCQTCHPNKYTEYTCYGCHEHEPIQTQAKHLEEGISALDLPDCARCHPTGLKEEGD